MKEAPSLKPSDGSLKERHSELGLAYECMESTVENE